MIQNSADLHKSLAFIFIFTAKINHITKIVGKYGYLYIEMHLYLNYFTTIRGIVSHV